MEPNQNSPRIVLVNTKVCTDGVWECHDSVLGMYFDTQEEFRELLRHMSDAK
jgi:hypothetical protein